MRWYLAVALLLLTLLAGCNGAKTGSRPIASSSAPVSTTPPDPWRLFWTDPTTRTPALLWNGLIGLRFGRDGTGTNQAMFYGDEYDPTGEQKIKILPNLLKASVDFDPKVITDYSQELDMRSGALTTAWKVNGSAVSVETVLDPAKRIIAQRWSGLTPSFGLQNGVSTPEPEGPSVRTQILRGDIVVSIGTPPGRNDILKAIGRKPEPIGEPPACPSFDAVEKASKDYWERAWRTDIEIDGPIVDQQAIHSLMFYLRSAIHPDGLMSVGPFGLSNERYSGHIFWDADIWVFPALALIDPEKAKVISDYRLARLGAAERNFDGWLKAGRPTASKPLGPASGAEKGAKFPWESSVDGSETTPGPTRFEDHITGDVVLSLWWAEALGIIPKGADSRAGAEGNVFWNLRSTGGTDQERTILGLVSPDENHTGDNDLYTNALVEVLRGRYDPPKQSEHWKLPHDDKSFLTYDGDPVRSYKQAAAVLTIYPLQFQPAEKEAQAMMDRFSDKITPNGPAMSDSVHALIWARLGQAERGYDLWLKDLQAFTNHPFLLFSEKKKQDAAYFTTGAGGCLQTVLYGFLGFRIDSQKNSRSAWAKELRAGQWLSVRPNLPQAWKSVKFKNFSVLGAKYTLTATHQGVQVTPGEK